MHAHTDIHAHASAHTHYALQTQLTGMTEVPVALLVGPWTGRAWDSFVVRFKPGHVTPEKRETAK